MAQYVQNFSKVVLRPFHATPKTVMLRTMPSPYHSHQRWPSAAQVQSGLVFGPGQFEQQEYETGTLTGGSPPTTRVYPFSA